jgi:putative ABC transport system permease protein
VFHMALRGVQHNTSRYVATLLAIITGVAFFAATGFISDHVIKALEGDADRQYRGVDVAIVVDEPDSGGGFAEPLTIPGSVADDLVALDGVEAGGGVLTGPVAFLAGDGSTYGDGATGRLWISDEQLNPVDVVDGSAPAQIGEVAVDQGLADQRSLLVGDQVTVLTVGGQFDSTIVGITAFGDQDALDQGGTVSLPEAVAFGWLRGGSTEYDAFYLRTSGDAGTVTEAAAAIVPTGFKAQTGEEFRADARDQAGSFGRFLKIGLQAFAALALFVGAFVIYNTFSVIVAQRQRELAVLSAIGATPKQLKRSLRYEGLVIGIIGSLLGVIAGALLALLLLALVGLLGVELPGSGGITVTPVTVIQGVLFGTLITFFSVTIPARRAAKIEPI